MSDVISDEAVDKALEFLRNTADEAAVASANVAYLAEFLKTTRATIKLRQIGVSNAVAEDKALAHPDYLAALDGYKEAVRQDKFYRFKREAADALIRAWQTKCSNLRAEGKAYG